MAAAPVLQPVPVHIRAGPHRLTAQQCLTPGPGILDIDIGYGLMIWEMMVSIWSSPISTWDILSLFAGNAGAECQAREEDATSQNSVHRYASSKQSRRRVRSGQGGGGYEQTVRPCLNLALHLRAVRRPSTLQRGTSMTKCVKPLRHLATSSTRRPARPIRTHHLDELVLLVAKCLSGFTHLSHTNIPAS